MFAGFRPASASVLAGRREDNKNVALQQWKIALNSLPYNFEVHPKVSVRQGISHVVCRADRQFRMCSDEVRKIPIEIAAGFADDLEVSDHCVLVTRTLNKLIVSEVGCVAFDPIDCFKDVVQKVVQLERVLPKTHTG